MSKVLLFAVMGYAGIALMLIAGPVNSVSLGYIALMAVGFTAMVLGVYRLFNYQADRQPAVYGPSHE